MTTIQRNLNGIIYQLTVKEEERMMMEEEEGEVALQEPTVADVGLDETGPTGLEAPSVKVMVSSLNETLSNVQYKNKNFEGSHLGGEGGRGEGSLAPALAAPGKRG